MNHKIIIAIILFGTALFNPTILLAQKGAILDLGIQSKEFGSQRQAQALLDLITGEPGKRSYRIEYKTDIDLVLFGCDFDKDIVLRMHHRFNDHGTAESWHGYIIDRLKNAKQGGSLNDTPMGKKLGTFQSFQD